MVRRSILMAALVAAASLALLGCAADADYPSLAPRAIEGVSLAEPAARAIPEATPRTAADARYAPIVARARDGDAAFRRAVEEARPALREGRAAPVGSDAWGEAQQRLSRLQSARAPVVEALAELQAASEAPDAAADRGLAEAAAHALETVRAIEAAEARTLDEAAPARS